MKDISDMRVIDHPSRDGFDLVQDIDVLQRRLIRLEREFQEAIRAYRDARVTLVSADAGVKACKAEIDIIKTRIMAMQSMLRAIPR